MTAITTGARVRARGFGTSSAAREEARRGLAMRAGHAASRPSLRRGIALLFAADPSRPESWLSTALRPRIAKGACVMIGRGIRAWACRAVAAVAITALVTL